MTRQQYRYHNCDTSYRNSIITATKTSTVALWHQLCWQYCDCNDSINRRSATPVMVTVLSEVHFFLIQNRGLSIALAKFETHIRSLILKHTFADPTDRTKSMTISTAQPPISFIVSLVLSAANSTLENQAVN